MIQTLAKRLSTVVIAAAAMLGGVGTAHAATVVGSWDPAFGAPFNAAGFQLGWSGTTQFTIADSCAQAGTVYNDECAMTIDSATVNFYNMLSPSAIVASLSFAPPAALPLSMYVPTSGGFPTGVNTNGTLGSVLSTNTSLAAMTLGTNYYWDLEFAFNTSTGNQEVRLYYTLNNNDDPRACAGAQSSRCGVSSQANGPVIMTVTPIPEPSTYALMLAGLGAVAFVARRRRMP